MAIVEGGRDLSEAFTRAAGYADRDGVYFLNDASDPDLPAGPAAIACEILEQAPQVRRLYVPMGDTALIRGVAFAAKLLQPGVRVIGVQAERAPSYFLSWKTGRVVETDNCDTIADGLATRNPLDGNVRAIRELVDEIRLVSEEQIPGAIRFLFQEEHVTAEPSGATAAVLREANVSDEVWALAASPRRRPA